MLVTALVLAGLGSGPARAANVQPLSGAIVGPPVLGTALKSSYLLNASGGPAFASNGTQVGILSFKAALTGANVSGASVTPPSGVLVQGESSVMVTAGNVTGLLTLAVEFTSGYGGQNVSTNVTQAIQVVVPYTLQATLEVGAQGVSPFSLTVTLDGAPVGAVRVASLAPGTQAPVTFHYATLGLPTGWHTFAISLVEEHGLVTFPGGSQEFSQAFYVGSPPASYTVDIIGGIAAFVGALFIWSAVVGGRRRGRRPR